MDKEYTPEELQTIIDALQVGAEAIKDKTGIEHWILHREVLSYVLGVIQEVKRGRE